MPSFVVRVELHGGANRYGDLHKEMTAKGFYQTFSDKKHRYKLPTAEYFINSKAAAAAVLQKAVDAVNSMKPPFPPGKETGPDVDGTSAILVTQAAVTLQHVGLKIVATKPSKKP